jgi:hypothetical protein
MLNGPFLLTGPQRMLLLRAPGAYILSRDGRMAHYVGRADTDLVERLSSSSRQGSYSHFWYEYAISAAGAYTLECRYYHDFRPTDNLIHPAAPGGSSLTCACCPSSLPWLLSGKT